MTLRELTLNAIKRKETGFIPFHFDLSPAHVERFFNETGTTDYYTYFKMPYYFLYVRPKSRMIDFSTYYQDIKQGTYFNEFGVGFEPGSVEHFTHMIFPMKGFTYLLEYEKYPYPDPDIDYDWRGLKKNTDAVKADDKLTIGALPMTIFEIGWYMRGMEEFLMDMYTDEEPLRYHIERITKIRERQAENYASAGVDVLHIGDDIATQQAMMFSIDMYREYIKPSHKRVIDAAKRVNPDILIDYHSDGNCSDAIPDLIEIGVDILNPVQPECIDPIKAKQMYGDRLTFRGTIGTQSTLPFGTVSEVRKEIKNMIDNVGRGGGLILAPSHIIEPEVPWENILAFIDVVKKHNKEYINL